MRKILRRFLFSIFILTLIIPAIVSAATNSEIKTTTQKVTGLRSRSTRLSVSPGATVYRDTDGFQTTFSVMEQFGPIFVGLESGYLRWIPTTRADYKGMAVGQTTIPMLATALYRFENDFGVYPYLGVAAGLALTRPDSGGNLFQMAAFARPGVEFEIASVVSLTLEPRVGILDSSFLFAPMVGLTLSL